MSGNPGRNLPKVTPAPEVQEYLNGKGQWPPPHRSEEPDHAYLDCFFCSGGRLTMQVETGLWDCKTCGDRGNLLTMKKRLGDLYKVSGPKGRSKDEPSIKGSGKKRPPMERVDKMVDKLWNNDGAAGVREYLLRVRAIPERVLRDWKVGAVKRRGKWWVAYTAFDEYGLPAHVKFRTVPPAKREFRRWKDCDTTLYMPPPGVAEFDYTKPLFICEGEPDLLSCHAYGIPNAITGTAGASQGWPDEWIEFARKFPDVYVALDRGQAGEAGSEKLAKAIGLHKCLRVRPPKGAGDWNEALAAGFERDFIMDCLDSGEPWEPEDIKPVSSYFEELKAMRRGDIDFLGESTGWAPCDDVWGGVRLGELTTVTGETGDGKTTWVGALALNMAKLAGWPVLFAELEHKAVKVVRKWVSTEAGKDVLDKATTTDQEAEDAMRSVEGMPLYMLDHWGKVEVEKLCDTIRWAAQTNGVKMAVIDHLHYMIGPVQDERQAIDNAMRELNRCALESNVHIVLVSHPRNITDGDDAILQMHHLKGSSGIKQESHNIISVWRRRAAARAGSNSGRPQTVITFLKVREDAGEEGRVLLYFDKPSASYSVAPQEWDVRGPVVEEDTDTADAASRWMD